MSDWLVHLIAIDKIEAHPNADLISLTNVYNQCVIVKRGLYKEGDLAVFLPQDSILPKDPENPIVKDSGLKPGHCIEARRLRGIFSYGMLVPAHICFTPEQLQTIEPGTHVAEMLGITKYEEADDLLERTYISSDGLVSSRGEDEKDMHYMPVYTDLDGWLKYKNSGLITEEDEVILTEKLHGSNARYCYRDNRLWCGSHKRIKKECIDFFDGQEKNLWWKVAKEIGLEDKFKTFISNLDQFKNKYSHLISSTHQLEHTVLYGEVFGQVQKGFNYGLDKGKATLRVFDSYDFHRGFYNDWDLTLAICQEMGVDTVPILYRGKWNPDLENLQNGTESVSGNSLHIREGFVVKPTKEKWDYRTNRVIFKMVGQDYKLHKAKHR